MNGSLHPPGQPHRAPLRLLPLLLLAIGSGCGDDPVDRELRSMVEGLELVPPTRPEPPTPALVRLGEALFFDKELSGNRDMACATCHHPSENSADGLSLPIGTGGVGIGRTRALGNAHGVVPRNSPDLYNRAAKEWSAMFWDGRVERSLDGALRSPAGGDLPAGLDGVLAAQALFPVTSRDEMRGSHGDVDVLGSPNELATIPDDELRAIWDALLTRLLRIDDYVALFSAAYPGTATADLGIEHAANAIAAYEGDAFWYADTPWDAYLEGDDDAIPAPAKRGALIFFGEGRCTACHAGPIFSDQRYHNVATPQLGPGKGEAAPEDLGRALVTLVETDRCAFRTPSLRNVTLTGPWMHDGAYPTLEATVRHMADPVSSLRSYDPTVLASWLAEGDASPVPADDILATVDPMVSESCELDDGQIQDLVAFLESLTDPSADDLSHLIPESVPSGLPVDRDPR